VAVLARDYDVPLQVVCAAYSRVERGIGRGSPGNMVLVKYVV